MKYYRNTRCEFILTERDMFVRGKGWFIGLGKGNTLNEFILHPTLMYIIDVFHSDGNTFFLTKTGQVYACGYNIGNSINENKGKIVLYQYRELKNIISIKTFNFRTYFITKKHVLKCISFGRIYESSHHVYKIEPFFANTNATLMKHDIGCFNNPNDNFSYKMNNIIDIQSNGSTIIYTTKDGDVYWVGLRRLNDISSELIKSPVKILESLGDNYIVLGKNRLIYTSNNQIHIASFIDDINVNDSVVSCNWKTIDLTSPIMGAYSFGKYIYLWDDDYIWKCSIRKNKAIALIF